MLDVRFYRKYYFRHLLWFVQHHYERVRVNTPHTRNFDAPTRTHISCAHIHTRARAHPPGLSRTNTHDYARGEHSIDIADSISPSPRRQEILVTRRQRRDAPWRAVTPLIDHVTSASGVRSSRRRHDDTTTKHSSRATDAAGRRRRGNGEGSGAEGIERRRGDNVVVHTRIRPSPDRTRRDTRPSITHGRRVTGHTHPLRHPDPRSRPRYSPQIPVKPRYTVNVTSIYPYFFKINDAFIIRHAGHGKCVLWLGLMYFITFLLKAANGMLLSS